MSREVSMLGGRVSALEEKINSLSSAPSAPVVEAAAPVPQIDEEALLQKISDLIDAKVAAALATVVPAPTDSRKNRGKWSASQAPEAEA